MADYTYTSINLDGISTAQDTASLTIILADVPVLLRSSLGDPSNTAPETTVSARTQSTPGTPTNVLVLPTANLTVFYPRPADQGQRFINAAQAIGLLSPMNESVTTGPGDQPTSPSPSDGMIPGTTTTPFDGLPNQTSPSSNGTGPVVSATSSSSGSGTGIIAGVAVATFVAGILLASALIWLCLRRRAVQRPGSKGLRGSLQDELKAQQSGEKRTNITCPTGFAISDVNSYQKSTIGRSTSMSGWQKHLPQEKDDRTIARRVATLFDLVQIHVQAHYQDRADETRTMQADRLDRIAPQDLQMLLQQSERALPVLETIFVAWIVRRIALSSAVEESLLPRDFVVFPAAIGQTLQTDGRIPRRNVASQKVAAQAFAQWRVLTAYLAPDPSTSRSFAKHVGGIIDSAVIDFAEAFAPWEQPRKGSEKQAESLRSILRAASEAGILLFQQPATLLFDWQKAGTRRTKSPALVKRLDEAGQVLNPEVVLVEAQYL
ncbi:hypothetical protein BDZ85DRAFT_282104 [Elsinoe ampelina]|uniref:Uncharacterized protein n=1 Tax=Elsinoe ampelina TaxID=302913 RepID=A0A6A6GBW2_9PEZI|nr:hypothetical protein BDZ85DRAFT_282104 [Elsinoe ampelina]